MHQRKYFLNYNSNNFADDSYQVDRLTLWMTTLHALANQTKDNFNDFKNDTENSLLSVRV